MKNHKPPNSSDMPENNLLRNKNKQPLKKKHVLLVVYHPVGGIRTFLRYVYRNFDPLKWRFTVIAPDVQHMRVLLEDLSMHDIEWVKIDKSSGYFEMTASIARQVVKGKYDLVHSHGFTSGMCAAFPAFVWRIPHLMTSHDVINKSQFSGVNGRLRKHGMALLFSLIDKVQSVSHDAQKNLLSFFPGLAKKNGKCLVIQNGIETERFLNAEPIDLRSELKFGNDVFLIGFFGRFMSQKGFGYLVEAVEILRASGEVLPKKPVVITLGEGGFLNREKRLIESKGLEGYFCHMAFTPNIAGVIKGVDVVAMPSLWEACGLLAMETLVCGTPLIASDCIGLREVVRNTPALSITKADSYSLSKALFFEMKHRSKAEYEDYKEKAIKRYDVLNTSKQLSALYKEMTSMKNRC